MATNKFNTQGLTDAQVEHSRKKYGRNELEHQQEGQFWNMLLEIAKEPMMLLLLTATSIYFISGQWGDGLFMLAAIVLQVSISIYQDGRSKSALDKLKQYAQPNAKVIRNGEVVEVPSAELVVGDSMVVEEGRSVPADGAILQSNDFSVNESILTGESFAVFKDKSENNNQLYAGTQVVSGLAIANVTAIGNSTQLGKIGKSLEDISTEKTPLELQIANFVKKMAIIGAVVFLIVWAINYWNSHQLLSSLLQSLTLAMSILPEEIPVAFTTFMALGAWRLMKMGVVVKQMKTVETLGSATIICTDKTGTITENKMSLARLYLVSSNSMFEPNHPLNEEERDLIALAMWASEPVPFDPMEIALHQAYELTAAVDQRPNYDFIHEYPLGGKPPMMTHIFETKEGQRIIAAKGAPEALMAIADLSEAEKENIHQAIKELTSEGYRVLGVGQSDFDGSDFPEKQQEFRFRFKGIVAFQDPPKQHIKAVLQAFYKAGISVKIITGDNAATTRAIAKAIDFHGYEKSISGDALMKMNENELLESVMDTNVFTRMFPEAKLRIINALKAKQQIVAMTGDGVNDGPALKAAHIGIAMGKKGTEIAKEAASLILLEDDLSRMVDAVAMGRKIYSNLKKAIQYIISIHIPIILTVFIPLALGWAYPNLFSPVHIIFLEIIMGPTCSIIYENEPMEKHTMLMKPKPFTTTFFKWHELSISIIQGLVITAGSLFIYQYCLYHGYGEATTRTLVFVVLIAANIFLTLINRSFYYSFLTTMKYKNNMVPMIIFLTIGIVAMMLFVQPVTDFFEFQQPEWQQLFLAASIGYVSVGWFELVKLFQRNAKKLY